MRRNEATIEAIGIGDRNRATATIRCPATSRPEPGQASLLLHTPDPDPLRYTAYPIELLSQGFRLYRPAALRWRPGDRLDLAGPIGRGFRPPSEARRWLLVALADGVDALMPLIQRGLDLGADVTLAAPRLPVDLPVDVEVIRSPLEALSWADYLAACGPRCQLGELLKTVGATSPTPLGCPSEALLLGTLPCGTGACSACAVPTAGGWSLACQAGPVFPLEDLRG